MLRSPLSPEGNSGIKPGRFTRFLREGGFKWSKVGFDNFNKVLGGYKSIVTKGILFVIVPTPKFENQGSLLLPKAP